MVLNRDFLAGLFFFGFGCAAIWIGLGYRLGSMAAMGPGYLPVAIGILLIILGGIIALTALLRTTVSVPLTFQPTETRALFFVLFSVIAFGLTIEYLGMIAATAVLILVSRGAGQKGSLVELIALMLVLIVISIAIFIFGLKMQLPLGPASWIF